VLPSKFYTEIKTYNFDRLYAFWLLSVAQRLFSGSLHKNPFITFARNSSSEKFECLPNLALAAILVGTMLSQRTVRPSFDCS